MTFLPRVNKRRIEEGSELFEVSISNISAEAQAVYGFDSNSAIRKFLPLNYCRIHNKGGTRLKIYMNQKTYGEPIDDDTVWTYYGTFFSFLLENLSTTSTATGATIFATVQKKGRS